MNGRQGLQHVRVATARHHLDRAADYVFDIVGFAGAEFIDQVHVDHVVRIAEVQVFAPRLRDREACRSHVGLARHHVRNDLGDAVDGIDDQLDAQRVGEFPDQVEFGTGWPVRSFDIADRTVTRDDAQLSEFEYLVQKRWRRGTGTQ